ncbi:MAG: hypothetical protein JJLCMIEE_00373 [Acidimicrobiales bacterium]|nr:hypothetical protein [Acidimicrobiales bacterium]
MVRALRNAVRSGTEGHAYLFSGPRGTGKTSTARILAKALNCDALQDGEPCGKCESCRSIESGTSYDLLELDAASNNGVDAMRELIARAALGSPGRTKVYILDEVHMLSAAASNALLKTLEEPPEHVRFVMATTDPQKVLPTIKSRTQHFEFRLLSASELEDYVRWIAKDAELEVDEASVAHVVKRGAGSARDTLSALDQVVAAGGVIVDSESVEELMEALCEHDAGRALVAVSDALAEGRDPRVLAEVVVSQLRDAFLVSMRTELAQLPDHERERAQTYAERLGPGAITGALEALGDALIEMRQAPDPRIPLEVALVRITKPEADASLNALLERIERLEHLVASGAVVEQPEGHATTPPPAMPRESPTRARGSGVATAREKLAQAQGANPDAPTRPEPRLAPQPTSAARPPQRLALGSHLRSARAPDSDETGEATRTGPDTPADEAVGPAASAGVLPTRDELTVAWGDSLLDKLKGRSKAIYGLGRFVTVTERAAIFALENAPTCERAERIRPEVEGVLAEHFGSPVPLKLIPESEAAAYSGSSPAPDPAEAAAGAVADDDHDVGDINELADADDVKTGVDKLTEAFPGAKLIDVEEK